MNKSIINKTVNGPFLLNAKLVTRVRLSQLQTKDEFRYIGAEDWHIVTRLDDERFYYSVGDYEQKNYRTDDVEVYRLEK